MTSHHRSSWDYNDSYPQQSHHGAGRDDYYYDNRRPPSHHPPRRRVDDGPTYKTHHKRPGSSKLRTAIDLTVRIIILVFLIAFFTLPQFEPYRDQFLLYLEEGLYQYKDIPKHMIFNIQRDMIIETSPDTEVREFTLTIEKPLDFLDENNNKVQELLNLTTYLPANKQVSEKIGKVQISWTGSVGFNDKVEITVVYQVKTKHIIWDISTMESGSLSDIPQNLKDQYNHDDWMVLDSFDNPMINPYNLNANNIMHRINPTDPDINALAHQLAGSETNVYKILAKFYDFLDKGEGNKSFSNGDECSYPDANQMAESRDEWEGNPKPARATLHDWVGDCDDQSFLLISMCRAVGIPARVEAGALWDSILGEWGGHGWAQVYVPLNDGTEVWATVDMVNNQFLERDPFRLTDYIGVGREGMLENYYTSWTYDARGPNVYISEDYIDIGHEAISDVVIHV
ncbi:MAG: transglutaminase domain-containing protein [Thermoplasmata archaeon]|nr:MAG: transglutaminase domain-containing protein [Thermoplasmata archaeon]